MPDGTRGPYSTPRALETNEIPGIVDQFRAAARNAIRAGFDGVEIHSAHGYLLDQFLKDGINDRSDEFGGSLENRCRLLLQVLQAVSDEIGSCRAAVRLSPIIDHNDARESDPVTLGLYLVDNLNLMFDDSRTGSGLAYLHVTEPRFTRDGLKKESELDDEHMQDLTEKQRRMRLCRMMRAGFNGPFMSSGGFDEETAVTAILEGRADLISFGRLFISNPDLPLRFQMKVKLTKYDRSTFYSSDQVHGYTDYPTFTSPRQANFRCFSFNKNKNDDGNAR